jgi:hypothetical protein
VQRIDTATIARRYFDPDTTPHAETPETLARYLRTMLYDLVQLALRNGSAVLASHLKVSTKQHGSAKLTASCFATQVSQLQSSRWQVTRPHPAGGLRLHSAPT